MSDHGDCHQMLHSLSEYIDGELSPEICALIDQHMAGCENCRIVVDTLRKTVSLYHTIQDAEPGVPDQVRQRLYKRLELDEFLFKPEPDQNNPYPSSLRAGDLCPVCGKAALDYDGMLNLACPGCGALHSTGSSFS